MNKDQPKMSDDLLLVAKWYKETKGQEIDQLICGAARLLGIVVVTFKLSETEELVGIVLGKMVLMASKQTIVQDEDRLRLECTPVTDEELRLLKQEFVLL